METQTCPGRASRQARGSMPIWARARGRALSTTISAWAIRARRAVIPLAWPSSRATLSLPAFRRSKNRGSPRRAPSGRWTLSALMTRAPLAPRSWAQRGPAQSDERSRTRGDWPGNGGVPNRRVRSARSQGVGRVGASETGATAIPIRRPRRIMVPRARVRSARWAKPQASSPAWRGVSSHAGKSSRSSGRARLRASQPSWAASRRQPPPGATEP